MTTLCVDVGFYITLIHKTFIDIKFNLKQSVCDLYITKVFLCLYQPKKNK